VLILLGVRGAEVVAEACVDPLEVDELFDVRAVVAVQLLDLPRQPLVRLPQVSLVSVVLRS
jgi:hypothetical protein